MHRILFLLTGFFMMFSCQPGTENSNSLPFYLPDDPQVVLSTNNSSEIKQYLQQLKYLGCSSKHLSTISEVVTEHEFERLHLGLYEKDSFNFVLSGKLMPSSDSIPITKTAGSISRFDPEQTPIPLYQLTQNDHLMISNDSVLLSSKKNYRPTLANRLVKVERQPSSFTLYLQGDPAIPLSQLYCGDTTSTIASNTVLYGKMNDGDFDFSGIMVPDSNLTKKLKGPATSKLLEVISAQSSQWQLLQPNLNSVVSKTANDSLPNLLPIITEIGVLQLNNDFIGLIQLEGTTRLIDELNLEQQEEFREIPIYDNPWKEGYFSSYHDLLRFGNYEYLAAFETFVLFSSSMRSLKMALSDYLNGSTVINSQKYKDLSQKLRSQFSYMSYGNDSMLKELYPTAAENYNTSYFQISKEAAFLHVNGLLSDYSEKRNRQPVVEVSSLEIDAELLSSPQLADNHLTGGKDIVVQDVQNQLYLISNNGKINWKKRMSGPILGRIEQIDMYKNGRLQLAFCTPDKLYVLDRNGNNVAPFPLDFKDPITQPLSVFDYDGNRNYRLLITQATELLMLNAKGKRVSGFNYRPDKNISSQPKHFRINRKDYIVFKTEDKLRILNRRGQNRIRVSESFDFSDNEMFLYQLQFTTTSRSGELVQVDTKGKVNKQTLGLPEEHSLVTTSKTLVTQTENKLNIKLKSVDLDYGIYSKPQIFYLNDKIYVTTTDRQSKKAYLYDSQGQPISGFPIFGVSQISMADLDVNRGLEVVLQTGPKAISILKLQ